MQKVSTVSEALGNFLRARATPANADLIARWSVAKETQVNVAADNGEPVAGKRNTWSNENGTDIWHPFRIPHDADSEPNWRDYPAPYLLGEHAEGIGMTGWDWQERRSREFGFDYDAILGHAKDGLSDEELDRVKQAAMRLPYIEVRRSTGGSGIHLYALCDTAGIATADHCEHAALARCILEKMSRDCNFDFTATIDCFGGNMWIWHRKMSEANQGLALLKPATQLISEADLPANWRDEIKKKPTKESTPTAKPAAKYPVDDDFCHASDFGFLLDHGWEKNGDNFKRPGTDKAVSASIVTAKDGTRVLHVFSTNAAPFEADGNYNAFRAYALVNHNGDSKSARESLETQGYGCKRFNLLTCDDLLDGDYTINYLVDKVLVAGQPCMIGGPQKGLKTSITLDLAISLATGSPFLGRFSVTRTCKVVVLTGESGLGTIQDTVVRISKSKNVSVRGNPNLRISDVLPQFYVERDIFGVDRLLRESGCKVLVLDPTYFCMSGVDAGNLFRQGEQLRPISEVCQRHGAGLILLHHHRKQGKVKNRSDYEPPGLNDLSWSGFAEFGRQWLLVGRREDYVPGTGSHKLWLNIGGSAGHSSLWALDIDEGVPDLPRYWSVALSTPEEARAEKKSGSIRARLLNAAREFPAGETKTALFTVAGLKSDTATRIVFDALVGEKVLTPTKVSKNGGNYDGFRFAPDSQSA